MDNWRDAIRQRKDRAIAEAIEVRAASDAAARPAGRGVYLSNAGTCARKIAYQMHNWEAVQNGQPAPFEAEPLDSRALLVFQLGNIVEAALKEWIERAGIPFLPLDNVRANSVHITVDGVRIYGRPDGLYQEAGGDGIISVPDIKSISPDGFDRIAEEGPDYGHVCQVTAEMAALDAQHGRLLYYNKATSHLEEWLFDFSHHLYREIVARFERVLRSTPEALPDREHSAEPEREWVRGRPKPDEHRTIAELKQNGYWVHTGRAVLPWQCRYCPFKKPCWGPNGLRMEFKGERPVWVVYRTPERGNDETAQPLCSSQV